MLNIRQGAQRIVPNIETKIIEEYGAVAQIISIHESKNIEGLLIVSLELVGGENVGKSLTDFVNYLPDKSTSWKYFALRKSAGVPYREYENPEIDIEELLINKFVKLSLSKTQRKDNDQYMQKINYLPYGPSLEKYEHPERVQVFTDTNENELSDEIF